MVYTKKPKIHTGKEEDAIEQPLGKDGYSSDRFNNLYGKEKNPYTGSERDRSKRKKYYFLDGYPKGKI